MKIVLIFLFFTNFIIFPQSSILPENKDGKVNFEEVVEAKNLGKELLFKNATKFVSSIKNERKRRPNLSINFSNGVISKKGSFFVYTQGLITPQIHGEITYQLYLVISDEGYKYTFTDFVFHYYQRNRYGRYAPVSGKYKYLEEEKFAGMQQTWENHKQATKDHIEFQIDQLKMKMEEMPTDAHSLEENDKNN